MITTTMYDFYLSSYYNFFYLTFWITGSHILFISILGLLNGSLCTLRNETALYNGSCYNIFIHICMQSVTLIILMIL